MLISKPFKNQGRYENCMPQKKDGSKILLKKKGFLSDPKNLRMKDERVGIIWKLAFGKLFAS